MKPTSLFDRVSQLLFPRIGSNMNPTVRADDDASRIARLLEKCPVGGLVLFNGTIESTPDHLIRLQSVSQYPLLIGTDMERGLAQQLKGATVFPHAYAFDAIGEDARLYLERSTGIAAREALGCGIHISFSPVADVHSNPLNPIISIRSYGSNVEKVCERVRAYIRICKQKGLLSTAKHFPGHGDTSTDSHEAVPIVEKDRMALENLELMPFNAAIDEGVDLIMTAHVAYPALDASGTIATKSRPILTDLLRNEMGFQGAIITDSLLMEGASSEQSDWEAAIVNAGADILLDIPDPVSSAVKLVAAVEKGVLSEDRVQDAFERVWALKSKMAERYGNGFFSDPSPGGKRHLVGSKDHVSYSEEIALAAVSIVSGSTENMPFSRADIDEKGLLVVLVRPHTTYNDPTASSLRNFVSQSFDPSHFVELTPESSERQYAEVVQMAERFGGVLVAAVVKPAAWHRFGLPEQQHELVEALVSRSDAVFASLGSPDIIRDFPGARLGICTYSDVASSCQSLMTYLARLLDQEPLQSS